MALKVGVLGAAGKMGTAVCAAVQSEPELELVAAVDPAFEKDSGEKDSGLQGPRRSLLTEAGAQVAVDFTRPDTVADNISFCVDHGIHCVVGTTGLSDGELEALGARAAAGGVGVFAAPNFSIGAVLSMHFAAQAARYMGSCEVVELHHNQKLDAPSGTAWATARRVAEAWRRHGRPPGGEPAAAEEEKLPGARGADVDGVRVHSVRLQGLVAHQEIVLGGQGQILTIRHDSVDRSSFMPGVVLAIKSVPSRPGLTVGLERLLGLEG